MNHNTILQQSLFLAVIVLSFVLAPLAAQDDNTLHIPPKLKVEVTSDERAFMRLLGVNGRDDEYELQTTNTIALKKRISWEEKSLLPMIFFNQGSSTVPERYQTFFGSIQADDYNESQEVFTSLEDSDFEKTKYLEIINIIGYRMTQYPHTTIALEGGYSTEAGEEAAIAQERAEVVKEYLQNIWRIAPERMYLLPPSQMCDSTDHVFKQEEARRVTIHSEDWQLLRPVRFTKSSMDFAFIFVVMSIDPWVAPSDVSDIVFTMASGDDIMSVTKLPVSLDSSTYRYTGLWILPRMIEDIEPSISAQAVVHTYQGTARQSNTISIPIEFVDDNDQGWLSYDMSDPLDEEEKEHYNGSILFFESGDTTLHQLQKITLEQRLHTIVESFDRSYSPEEKWTITIYGRGEASENPDVDEVYLRTSQATHRNARTYVSSLFSDRSFQVPLYIFPASLKDFTSTSERMSTLSDDLTQTWLGDRADEIKRIEEQSRDLPKLSTQEIERFDTLLQNRARSVKEWIQPHLDSSRIDTMYTRARSWGNNSYMFTPEERFYARLVTVEVSTYDPYEEAASEAVEAAIEAAEAAVEPKPLETDKDSDP